MQPLLNEPLLAEYRRRMTCCEMPSRLTTIEQALEFISSRELIAFWPVKNNPIPSLWSAVAGDRPVADEHDDPGHVTWGWKDSFLGQKKCFYSRILCKRNFFARLELLPYLYALSNNYGDIQEDHLILYNEGRMSFAARQLYGIILDHGALDIIELKRLGHFTGKAGDAEFNKALIELQMDYKLMPVGISDNGAWHYSFIYDIVGRQYPEAVLEAGKLEQMDCREHLLMIYLRSTGAVRITQVSGLFHWSKGDLEKCLQRSSVNRKLSMNVLCESTKSDDWVALPDLVLQ